MSDDSGRDLLRVPGHEVDHAGRHARRLEQLHDVVIRERRRVRRLPHGHVAHEGGRARQVAADGREVERADRVHEAFEAPVVRAVPGAGAGPGLQVVDAARQEGAEAEEVDQLARAVDLGLIDGLALTQHCRRIELVPPRTRQEVGGPQEHGGSVLPTHGRPFPPRVERGRDRRRDLLGPRRVHVGQDVAVIVGHDDRRRAPLPQLPASDDDRDVDDLGGLPVQLGLERRLLGASRPVRQDRLVVGKRDVRRAVHAEISWGLRGGATAPPGRSRARAARVDASPQVRVVLAPGRSYQSPQERGQNGRICPRNPWIQTSFAAR